MSADLDFDRVLALALDRLAAGEPAAVVLADQGAHAAALAPLLAVAEAARATLGGPVPAPDLAPCRRRFLAAAESMRPASRPFIAAWRPALALLALCVVLLVGAGAASANALPGEALYPVKRAVEAVQLALTFDPAQRVRLTVDLAARRRAEAARLLDLRREAVVAFTGTVEAVSPGRLLISGLAVLTDTAAGYAPGDLLAVEARATRTGELVATRLTRLGAAPRATAPPIATPRAPTTTNLPRSSATPGVRASSTAAPATERPTQPSPAATLRPAETATGRPSVAAPTPTERGEAATAPPTERPADASATPSGTPAQRPSDRPPRAP